MRSIALHALAMVTLAGSLVSACGGQSVGGGPSTAGASGSSSSGGSSGVGGHCAYVDLSTYDQSCHQASDCVYIQSGDVCDGLCRCGNAVVNASEQKRYAQAVSSIQSGICNCRDMHVPQCIGHRCTIPYPDAGSCVDIDLSTYDQTCKADTDCIGVTAGVLCPGGCACGGSTINVDGEARYQAAVAAVETAACPCVANGVPRCIQNRCTLCGVGHPGCGDGG